MEDSLLNKTRTNIGVHTVSENYFHHSSKLELRLS